MQLLTWQCLVTQSSSQTQFCCGSLQQVGILSISEWIHESQQLTTVSSKLAGKSADKKWLLGRPLLLWRIHSSALLKLGTIIFFLAIPAFCFLPCGPLVKAPAHARSKPLPLKSAIWVAFMLNSEMDSPSSWYCYLIFSHSFKVRGELRSTTPSSRLWLLENRVNPVILLSWWIILGWEMMSFQQKGARDQDSMYKEERQIQHCQRMTEWGR